MKKFNTISAGDLARITDFRNGEIKFGEKMLTVPKNTDFEVFIQSCDAPFVLFGIPEDIGVRANFGRVGTATCWETAIKSIANLQHNKYCKGSKLLVLGAIDLVSELEMASKLDPNLAIDRLELFELVKKIDKEVAHLVYTIVKAGKTPIVIGGGHNNAYGNIKGTALAFGKPINAINFDAHTDFRALEGRHSGNGFSYAMEEGFLKKYFAFGIHENYISKSVLDSIKKIEGKVRFNTFEEMKIVAQKSFENELLEAADFINNDSFGLEIDLDAIALMGSSAVSCSGFSAQEARRFVSFFGGFSTASYLHICEGAPDLDSQKNPFLVGKMIGYLITDFIKAKPETV